MFVGVGAKRVRDVFEMARVVFTHIFFGLCGRGKEPKAGQRGAVKRCRPYGVCPFTRAMGHSYAVGSSLQYLCKEYLKALVHQEFSDIDSDSGTYSDANGIKKLPLLPRQLVKQGGSVKLWRVPLFWLACAHNLLLNVKFSPFCFARVFFKIFNHSCSCSSCIRRNFCGGAGDCGEHGRVGLT